MQPRSQHLRTYKAFVRPAGLLECEIPKEGLTAAEIMLLRYIHKAEDAVVKIEIEGMDKRPHKAEYDRLVGLYAGAINKETGVHAMATLFGPAHYGVKLPVDLPGFEEKTPADTGAADAYFEAEQRAFAEQRVAA
jgi:hypothetical protein